MPLPPFERAAADGDYDRVRFLMENTPLTQHDYDEALVYAAIGGYDRIVRDLFRHANNSYRNYQAFKVAAYDGHLSVVTYFYSRVAIPELVLSEALEMAATHGHFPVVQFLVQRGADVHFEDDHALRTAARTGHLLVAEYLIDHGANVDAEDGYPLIIASENGDSDLVSLLIDRGADVDVRDGAALSGAIQEGHLDIVDLLVSKGATVTDDILEIARESGNEEIMDYLEVDDDYGFEAMVGEAEAYYAATEEAAIAFDADVRRMYARRVAGLPMDEIDMRTQEEVRRRMADPYPDVQKPWIRAANDALVRAIEQTTAVKRALPSGTEDAIAQQTIEENEEYVLCESSRPHAYLTSSIVGNCMAGAVDCNECPQCKERILPQKYINASAYTFSRSVPPGALGYRYGMTRRY